MECYQVIGKHFFIIAKTKRSCSRFFSHKTVCELNGYKIVVAAANGNVLSNQSLYLDDIMPSYIEEVDQSSKHLIKTVDSDVIVISVTVFDQLEGVQHR